MASVYILYSECLDSYYVGSCNDIEDRVKRHNSGYSIYTRRGIPWKVVYQKEYPTKSEAMKEEYRIKKQKSRKYIEQLIQTE
jgi:putative endonuclease